MKKKSLHTALKIFTLCVMMLTSTGFTAIVNYCTMTEASSCCCEEAHESTVPSSDGLSLSSPVASCDIQTIAGGRNEIDATVHAAESVDLPALAVMPFASDAICAAVPDRTSPHLSTDDAAPPGVDIYIRVNSFLI